MEDIENPRLKPISPVPHLVSLGFGLITGIAAGLIGVGGGEFRLPLLLHYLKDRPKTAAGINLLVGLFTVALSLARRWGLHRWEIGDMVFVTLLAIASAAGALAGARFAHSLGATLLKRIIVAYLLLVGAWMLFESFSGKEHVFWQPQGAVKLISGLLVGFGIAFASATFGVAGGEMRIPALLYIFAFSIKEAGTVSLAASVPTVATGALSYRLLGHMPKEAIIVAAVMGTGSLVGVLLGTALLPWVGGHLLRGVFGVILLAASVGLIRTKEAG